MNKTLPIIATAKSHLLQNYRTQPIVIDRGEAAQVWDVDGRRYLDMLGGIAVCALGHCHPVAVKALREQAAKLWHVSNVFYSQPQIELATKLTAAAKLERAFFCNSGAEANEAMAKLARKVQKDRGAPDRYEVICFENSFHGRTLAMIAATGQLKYQKGFEPMPRGFLHVPFGDLDAVKRAIGPGSAAIMVEVIQGEGGVRAAPSGFLQGLRELCDQYKLLLLVDEVQTGMGRTGTVFAFQQEHVQPDAISLAKALGNGIPIGAMLCREEHGSSLSPGSHGSTFGGNPLAASVANAVFDVIADPTMLSAIREKGEYFIGKARQLQQRLNDKIVAVRGRGLLIGIETKEDSASIVGRCREQGLLVNAAGEKTVRFAPPFIIGRDQLDEGLRLFEQALSF